jgi:hypothetical protein
MQRNCYRSLFRCAVALGVMSLVAAGCGEGEPASNSGHDSVDGGTCAPDTPSNGYCGGAVCPMQTTDGLACGFAAQGGSDPPPPGSWSDTDDSGKTVTGTRDRFTSCYGWVDICQSKFPEQNNASDLSVDIVQEVQQCVNSWALTFHFAYQALGAGAAGLVVHKAWEHGELYLTKYIARKISQHCAETCVPVIGWAIEAIDIGHSLIELGTSAYELSATKKTDCINQPCADAWNICNAGCQIEKNSCDARNECVTIAQGHRDPNNPDQNCFAGQNIVPEACDLGYSICKDNCQKQENYCVALGQ